MKNRKAFLVYVVLCLAIVLTSVATTLALVTDEHQTSDATIKFDKVAIMGHGENGSNLSFTLSSDYVGDGELVFNGSGENDYLWIRPTSDTADMFLRFRVYFTLGSEELDEANAETLALLNNGNGVPQGFKLYEDESLDYELIPYDGWVYVCAINDEIIEVENKILKVVQNTNENDRNYIISKEYRLDYDKENDEEAIFNMISLNDNQITLKVEAHAIQCFGLGDNIQDVLEETQNGNHLILDSKGQNLEDSYGNVTIASYKKAIRENDDLMDLSIIKTLKDCTPQEIKYLGKVGKKNDKNQWVINEEVWFNVGDEKTITLTNGQVLTLQIADFNHDVDEKGKVVPFTFITKELMKSEYRMNLAEKNEGGWEKTEMYTYLNQNVWNLIPDDWKAVINTSIIKKSTIGNQKKIIVSSVNKLFLLSYAEVGFSTAFAYGEEGTYYPIFTKSNRCKENGNILTKYWWLRSPCYFLNDSFGVVDDEGGGTFMNSKYYNGICFAFCV